MSLETKIFTILTTDPAVSAVIASRCFPVVLPQNVTLPAVSYQRISGGQENSLKGSSNLENPRIQVDVWGTTYSAVKDLAAKVMAAMRAASTFKALVISDQDLFEDETETYRVSIDFSIWHRTEA
jgi:hypothetical protein